MRKVLGALVGALVLSAGGQAATAKTPTKVTSAVNASTAKSVTLPVEGMSCASCAARIKRALKGIDGVEGAAVNLGKRNVTERFTEKKVSVMRLQTAINALGYKAGTPLAEKRK